MNFEDLKSQLAVLRKQMKGFAEDESLPIDSKINKVIKLSREIRKLYILNQNLMSEKIRESLKNKPLNRIDYDEALRDPLDNQNPLKTQLAYVRHLLGSKNAKGDYTKLGELVEEISEGDHFKETLKSFKQRLKIFQESRYIDNLNLKENPKRIAVSKANMKLGFEFIPVQLEDLDEEPFD